MPTSPVNVVRRPERFTSDDSRVITRLFLPGGESRIRTVIQRVLQLSQKQASALLDEILASFAKRHQDVETVFRRHFDEVARYLEPDARCSDKHRLLIGAYFTKEYSFESAALFNPSIVPHHDQQNLPAGSMRFLMSLRATGEGHVSSIVFRTGVIGSGGEIHFEPAGKFARSLKPKQDRLHDKQRFFHKLIEMAAYTELAGLVLDQLDDPFQFEDLNRAIDQVARTLGTPQRLEETADNLRWLSQSNYVLEVPAHTPPCEVVIFPSTENESKGIEDMRLVHFVDDDGSTRYYGTYTAYNGINILPQLMETHHFERLRIITLNGRYVQNKGMALFPRKIDGWYLMVARQDGESLYLLRSKNIRFWNEAQILQRPKYPWEFVQIGNCGSPLETPRGWLLLTHGVGAMREYCIGASLFDLEDPSRLIGQTREPILVPNAQERDGYVPNVVYTCGALIHGDQLIMPYAMSDSSTGVATLSVSELLDHLTG